MYLPNYATKKGLKNTTGIDTSKPAAISDLAKSDKIDVVKLKTVPVDLNKLSNVDNNDVAKKLCVIK